MSKQGTVFAGSVELTEGNFGLDWGSAVEMPCRLASSVSLIDYKFSFSEGDTHE